MSREIDNYVAAQPEAQARALRALRKALLARIATAGIAVEEVISYNMPGFRILSGLGQGKVLLGYASWKDHLALYPHSGTVLSRMQAETRGMSQTKSALHLPIGSLPKDRLVDRMIHLRLEELE